MRWYLLVWSVSSLPDGNSDINGIRANSGWEVPRERNGDKVAYNRASMCEEAMKTNTRLSKQRKIGKLLWYWLKVELLIYLWYYLVNVPRTYI